MNDLIAQAKAYFRRPTPLEMIAKELAEAHLSMLQAETAADYAKSLVEYNVARIERLDAHMDRYTRTRTKKEKTV